MGSGFEFYETRTATIGSEHVSENSNPEPIFYRWLLATLVAWRQEMGPGGFEPPISAL